MTVYEFKVGGTEITPVEVKEADYSNRDIVVFKPDGSICRQFT